MIILGALIVGLLVFLAILQLRGCPLTLNIKITHHLDQPDTPKLDDETKRKLDDEESMIGKAMQTIQNFMTGSDLSGETEDN